MYSERAGRLAGQLIAAIIGFYVVAGAAGAAHADTPVSPAPGQEIAPVPRLFERVHASFHGRILKVELELADPPAYEVKLLTENGNVLMLSYDAMTLRLDSVVGHRDTDDDTVADVRPTGESDDADDAEDARDDDDDAGDGRDDDRNGGGDHDRSGPGGGDDDGGNSGPGGGDDDHSGPGGGGNSGPGGGDDD